jgi:hypothetical protein
MNRKDQEGSIKRPVSLQIFEPSQAHGVRATGVCSFNRITRMVPEVTGPKCKGREQLIQDRVQQKSFVNAVIKLMKLSREFIARQGE